MPKEILDGARRLQSRCVTATRKLPPEPALGLLEGVPNVQRLISSIDLAQRADSQELPASFHNPMHAALGSCLHASKLSLEMHAYRPGRSIDRSPLFARGVCTAQGCTGCQVRSAPVQSVSCVLVPGNRSLYLGDPLNCAHCGPTVTCCSVLVLPCNRMSATDTAQRVTHWMSLVPPPPMPTPITSIVPGVPLTSPVADVPVAVQSRALPAKPPAVPYIPAPPPQPSLVGAPVAATTAPSIRELTTGSVGGYATLRALPPPRIHELFSMPTPQQAPTPLVTAPITVPSTGFPQHSPVQSVARVGSAPPPAATAYPVQIRSHEVIESVPSTVAVMAAAQKPVTKHVVTGRALSHRVAPPALPQRDKKRKPLFQIVIRTNDNEVPPRQTRYCSTRTALVC